MKFLITPRQMVRLDQVKIIKIINQTNNDDYVKVYLLDRSSFNVFPVYYKQEGSTCEHAVEYVYNDIMRQIKRGEQ